ncbi:hypothetical protein ACJIZ3_003949 [Penstemon smallii]|uniref:Hydroxyproline-rich glycoprotein family protein n=1 Tax=Penstemon smallii TaxID=265156 RepID=A0ABD3S0M8_9LAMI
MRRGVVNGTDALETINAAATVIASTENRVPHASVQKKRWISCWSHYWCFGSHKNKKRIGHAVLVPDLTVTGAEAPIAEHPSQPPPIILPFVAPPSSPVSFLPSEPQSAIQSPTGPLSLTSVSANMYSPGGPTSIFAIGPYAHETQLVSPPVFSTFTTEPSTAPYTPPSESIHLTTPSSPEVPFARLLEPNLQSQRFPFSQYEFQSYQLQPGSPLSHLISPCSGISGSGTSTPFPDHDFATGHPFFPKLLDLDKIVRRDWESRQVSGAATPDATGPTSCDIGTLNRQHSDVGPLNGLQNNDVVIDPRVSFEITSEEVIRCVEKKPVALPVPLPETGEEHDYPTKQTSTENTHTDGDNEQRHQKNRTITLGSTKEFNFDNVDGGNSGEPSIGSDWWANEKVHVEEGGPIKNWSFFPMVETGVS